MSQTQTQPNNRNEWIFSKCSNILESREDLLKAEITKMLAKSVKIFKYNGLPDTIKHKDLETILQVNGFAIWKRVNGEMYVFFGGLGGVPNPYYLPTIAIVANPALRYNAELKIDEECVVMLNDFYYQGMMPLFNKYANLLIDAELSLRQAIINSRVPAIIEADNESAKESAVEFLDNVYKGEKYGIVGGKTLLDNIKTHEFTKETHITDIIEAIQYIKGSWYNELGLNAAFNMKREAINEAEATLNEDILRPLIDLMLECRKKGLELVNEMFGTNITVELDSAWEMNKKQDELALELEEKEVEDVNKQDTTIVDTTGTDTN